MSEASANRRYWNYVHSPEFIQDMKERAKERAKERTFSERIINAHLEEDNKERDKSNV